MNYDINIHNNNYHYNYVNYNGELPLPSFLRECDFLKDNYLWYAIDYNGQFNTALSDKHKLKGIIIKGSASYSIRTNLRLSENPFWDVYVRLMELSSNNYTLGYSVLVKTYCQKFKITLHSVDVIYDILLNYIFDNYAISYISNRSHIEVLFYENIGPGVPDFLLEHINLQKLSSLKVLNIVDNHTGEKFFSQINLLSNLEYLYICDNPNLNSSNVHSLSKLKNIRALKLDCCSNVDDSCIRIISEMTSLEYLHIDSFNSNFKITDEGFRQLHKLKNLKYLVLNNVYISDATLKEISSLKSLQEVSLRNCPYITNQGIESLQLLPNLTSLSLSNCDRITELNSEMFLTFPKLTELSLFDFSQTSSVSLQNLTKAPYLKTLILFNISGLNDRSIDFDNQSSKLEYVLLSNCPLITDVGLKQISKLNNLKFLTIVNCPLITDSSIVFLKTANPNISFLLMDCNGCSDSISNLGGLRDMQEAMRIDMLYGGFPVYTPESKDD